MISLRECRLVEDGGGRLWLDKPQLIRAGFVDHRDIEIIEVDGKEYLEVMGYSNKRQALWVRPVEIEGAADNIEQELDCYGEGMGGGGAR